MSEDPYKHLDTLCSCCFGQDEPDEHCRFCGGTGELPEPREALKRTE